MTEKEQYDSSFSDEGLENGADEDNKNEEMDQPESTDMAFDEADEEQHPTLEELDELRNKYLRLAAEFDNYRKRTSRERRELIETADKDVIISLLDVLDDSERASQQMETTDNIDVVKEGALLIFNKLNKILRSRGLKEMESLHADFDAELHDAIAEVPAPSEELKGKIMDNIQKGYYLGDKLIRHAKVVVGK